MYCLVKAGKQHAKHEKENAPKTKRDPSKAGTRTRAPEHTVGEVAKSNTYRTPQEFEGRATDERWTLILWPNGLSYIRLLRAGNIHQYLHSVLALAID